MSRASLYDESINERSIDELFQNLDPNSLSKTTWGIPTTSPIKATTGPKTKNIGKRLTKRGSTSAVEERWAFILQDMKGPQVEIIPNGPKRSHLLRMPLEIRERIYAYLLKCPSPILVQRDWRTVETTPSINHPIRRVCKQVNHEGTTYLYKQNSIQAVFRKNTRAFSFYNEPAMIDSRYIAYYQNVIMDFDSECWSYDWYEKATESLQILIAAKAVLKSLTLVVAPKRVGTSTTALGMESSPVTFADFVWYDGDFMRALCELAPREFKIIIKKGATKKLTVLVDLKYLGASEKQQANLANLVTSNMLLRKECILADELRGLKDRFEEIFEDDAWAVRERKCTTNEVMLEMPPLLISMAQDMSKMPNSLEISTASERDFGGDPEEVCTDIGENSEDGGDSEDESDDES